MALQSVRVKPWSRVFGNIRQLLLSQFPKDELYPILPLRLMTLKKNFDCTAFLDEGQFVGFYYLLLSEKLHFLLYTAVAADRQSKGYGGAIQKAIREKYPDQEIVCHIEMPKPSDTAGDQTIRRLRFYERNGYAFTGYKTMDEGVKYWVMSTRGRDFDRASYDKLFRDMEGEKGVPKLELVRE